MTIEITTNVIIITENISRNDSTSAAIIEGITITMIAIY